MVCLRVLTGLVLLCVGATTVAQPVYHWKDERGVQHFSDVPPDGIKSEVVKYSNVSVIPMFGSDTAASAADESVPPACEPGVSGDEACETGQQAAVPEPESAVASPEDRAAANKKRGEIREDVLESETEKLSDYDKKKRIKEIEAERELRKERRLTPGDRKPDDSQNDDANRFPKTVSEKLRTKNKGESPE